MRIKKAVTVFSVLFALTLAALVGKALGLKKLENKLEAEEKRTYYELLENVEKIEDALLKAALSSDFNSLGRAAAEVRECTAFAVSDLGRLPSGDEGAAKITSFLNQAADYSKSTVLRHSDLTGPTREEAEMFFELSEYAAALSDGMTELSGRVASGEAALSEAGEKIPDFGDGISRIENESFSDYEDISYDGPFSAHMNTLSSVMLESEEEVSADYALRKAMECLGGRVVLTLAAESEGVIESYIFSGNGSDTHYAVGISKRGGRLLFVNAEKSTSESKASEVECASIALSFAENAGYENLKETYRAEASAVYTFNFAPEENGTVMYPDLVRVKVSADDGTVVAFSAYGYLLNHRNRSLPQVDLEAAREVELNSEFTIEDIRTAVIPTPYAEELYCFELSGSFKGKRFLIYINTQTGKHEETLVF